MMLGIILGLLVTLVIVALAVLYWRAFLGQYDHDQDWGE